jgi:hypothetical protein
MLALRSVVCAGVVVGVGEVHPAGFVKREGLGTHPHVPWVGYVQPAPAVRHPRRRRRRVCHLNRIFGDALGRCIQQPDVEA